MRYRHYAAQTRWSHVSVGVQEPRYGPKMMKSVVNSHPIKYRPSPYHFDIRSTLPK